MTNRSFTRQAKSVMNQAKERASDLPEVGGACPADHGPKEQLGIEQSIHAEVRMPDNTAAKDEPPARRRRGGTPELVRRSDDGAGELTSLAGLPMNLPWEHRSSL
jgi:hypothetical protein